MSIILNNLIKDHGASMEQAKSALKGWTVHELKINDEVVGEYMMQNSEIHVALKEDKRLKLGKRNLIKKTLAHLLETNEFLVTKLFKNDKCTPLIEYMGFVKTHEDTKFNYFWLDKESCKCLL
jgi:hypothetical protein